MDKNKKITIFLHILVWMVLFSMPYLLWYGQEHDIHRLIAHFWIPLALYVVLFYINYGVLIERMLFRKKTILFIGLNLVLIILFALLREHIENTFFLDLARKATSDKTGPRPPYEMRIYMQMLSYLPPLLFAIAIKTTKRWAQTESESKEAKNFKLQSELQHLHYQLQPHFFFNALNNIYSMVDVSPDQAKKSIHGLSKLMRYMLYETNMELVPLAKEIDFMTKYIELMKLRLTDKTTVDYHFPAEDTQIQIAPLLFISLIENAFKHGVSASMTSQINIGMTLKKHTILFHIVNDNFPKQTEDKSGSGIGFENLEKRLKLLYPNKFVFKKEIINDKFSVTLELQTL